MNDSKIEEVYALRSDISWMNDKNLHTIDHAEMNIYKPESSNDIPIMTWTYEDKACQGVWMRAEALNGKFDPMYGFSVSIMGDKGMIEVLGEGGRGLQWQGKDVHLILHRKDKGAATFRFDEGGDDIWQSEVSYYSKAHMNQIHEFVEALTSGVETRYTGGHGLKEIKTAMAAICSAKEGLAIKVDEVTDARFAS